jgi:hypothetical protein
VLITHGTITPLSPELPAFLGFVTPPFLPLSPSLSLSRALSLALSLSLSKVLSPLLYLPCFAKLARIVCGNGYAYHRNALACGILIWSNNETLMYNSSVVAGIASLKLGAANREHLLKVVTLQTISSHHGK